MKIKKKLRTYVSLALLIGLSFLYQGCGEEENKQIPPDGSTITINPDAVELVSPTDAVQNYTVVVKYADGNPIPYAIVHISSAFSAPFIPAQFQFYYYVDGPNNPEGNTAVNSGFYAQTDEFGIYEFSAVIFGGTVFEDTIYLTSGSAYAESTLKSGETTT